MIHPTAKVSEQVNKNCHSRNAILQLPTPPPTLTLSPQTHHCTVVKFWLFIISCLLCWSRDHFIYIDVNFESRSLMVEYCDRGDDWCTVGYFAATTALLVNDMTFTYYCEQQQMKAHVMIVLQPWVKKRTIKVSENDNCHCAGTIAYVYVCQENSRQSAEIDQLCAQLSELTKDHQTLEDESTQVNVKMSQERIVHTQVSSQFCLFIIFNFFHTWW